VQIAILSDIHDHIWNLARALQRLEQTDRMFCLGDLCSPFVLDMLAQGYDRPIDIVFGNNDADTYRITLKANAYPHVQLHGEFFEITLDNRRFAVNHYDQLARAIAASERYDVVCFGHNHQRETTRQGRALLINPGPIMGACFASGKPEAVASSCAIYDTAADEVRLIEV
jgi:putative phosphoesterase